LSEAGGAGVALPADIVERALTSANLRWAFAQSLTSKLFRASFRQAINGEIQSRAVSYVLNHHNRLRCKLDPATLAPLPDSYGRHDHEGGSHGRFED
jgi:hypothetical protein